MRSLKNNSENQFWHLSNNQINLTASFAERLLRKKSIWVFQHIPFLCWNKHCFELVRRYHMGRCKNYQTSHYSALGIVLILSLMENCVQLTVLRISTSRGNDSMIFTLELHVRFLVIALINVTSKNWNYLNASRCEVS